MENVANEMKAIYLAFGLLQTGITIGAFVAILKFKIVALDRDIASIKRVLFGNGKGGVMDDISDCKSEIKSVKTGCAIRHPKTPSESET